MKNNKERTAVWLYPETMERLDGWLNQDNCKSRSEFIEKALCFYMGYLGTEDTSSYLSKALLSSMEGTLQKTENRVASNLFRLSVEISMMMHLLATTLETGVALELTPVKCFDTSSSGSLRSPRAGSAIQACRLSTRRRTTK